MRLRACTAIILLGLLAACQTLPETVKVEVDGHGLEFKKKPSATAEAPDGRPR
jgi:hypothetical protein